MELTRTWTIGASPDCDVVVDQPMVSGHHCRLTQIAQGLLLEDLHSTNGTFVNGLPITAPTRVLQTDVITLGRSVPMPWPQMEKVTVGRAVPLCTAFKVAQRTTVIGRDQSCDLVLDDPRVSREHARLTREADATILEDLRSSNGTFVNGIRVEMPLRLRVGDIVAIGRYTFTLTAAGDLEQRDYRGNVTIEARGVGVDVPGRRLLENISLTVYPSEFVGLMGPSGAGKTTLMNAMNGYTPPTTGTVIFNGCDLYANYEEFQGMVGYVPQDDIMHRELTVGQALYYTARLRLPSDFSNVELHSRIQDVLSQLGLEGTENVVIGSPEKKGISGGQRKRVNLAMELLTDPAVLFLDEPTSGLSSEDALMVMKLLRKLADAGKTIVLTVHQPSLEAYRLLDNLILVSKDAGSTQPGQLVYYGPAYPQAVDFFNPQGVAGLRPEAEPSPDEVLRGLSKEKTSVWIERYSASPWKQQYIDYRAGQQPSRSGRTTVTRGYRAFGFHQWWTLVRRCLTIKVKDRANTAILLAQAPIIAILVSLVFGKDAAAKVTTDNWASVANATSITIFLLALSALWFGCSNSAREIVGEWAIYHRERMVSLKIPSYLASKFAVLGTLCFLQCVILLGILHWGTGLEGTWWTTFPVLLLSSLLGLAIGLTISVLARTSEVAIALLPLILLPMVILAGVLQPVHKMSGPIKTVALVMPSRWAFEGLLLLEAGKRPKWTPPTIPASSATGDPSVEAKAETPPSEQDMAERFFPAETHRTDLPTSALILTMMLVVLVGAIGTVLLVRDVR